MILYECVFFNPGRQTHLLYPLVLSLFPLPSIAKISQAFGFGGLCANGEWESWQHKKKTYSNDFDQYYIINDI